MTINWIKVQKSNYYQRLECCLFFLHIFSRNCVLWLLVRHAFPMFSYFVNVIQKFEKSSLENFHTNAHKTFKILNRLYVNLDCLSQWRVYHKETFKILLKTIIDIDKNVFWTWQSIIQILYFAGNSLALVSFKQEVQGLTLIFKSSRSVGLLQHFFLPAQTLLSVYRSSLLSKIYF